MEKSLSVLLPCYNEEENITECLNNIPNIPNAEVIVIDDGSNDNTAEFARKHNVRVISYKPNRGKGYAIRKGLEKAKGDIAVILDADMNPKEIPKIIEPILKGKADFVNGTRFRSLVSFKDMNLFHQIGNRIFALLVSIKIRKYITDSLCGFKAFPTELFRHNLQEDKWMDFELLIKAKRYNLRIDEVPIKFEGRKKGATKMNPIKDSLRLLKNLMK